MYPSTSGTATSNRHPFQLGFKLAIGSLRSYASPRDIAEDVRGGVRLPQADACTSLAGYRHQRPRVRTHRTQRAARREWRRAGELLVEMGLMTNLDVASLASYCVGFAHLTEATNALKSYGLMMKSPMQSRYLAVLN